MSDLRQYVRSLVAVDLVFSVLGGTTSFAGTGADLSVGGMFIATRTKLEAGTPLVIRMRPSLAHDELALQGTVRWSNGVGLGVQFAPMGAKDTHILTEYLRALKP